MTTYQTVPTVASNDSWSASQHNTYIRDNFKAIMENGTAGALLYFQTANNVAAISPSTSGNILQSNGTTWQSVGQSQLTSTPGLLHAIGTVDFAPGGQTFSGAYADITGGSLSLVVSKTCNIIMWASVVGYNNTAGNGFKVRGVIAGTADGGGVPVYNGGAATARNEALPYFYPLLSVTAGTHVCKLQCTADSTTNTVERGRLMVLAYTA